MASARTAPRHLPVAHPLTALAASADGRVLATTDAGSPDRIVLRDADSGAVVATLEGARPHFLDDARLAVFRDEAWHFYDPARAEAPVATVAVGGPGAEARLSRDGRWSFTEGAGVVRLDGREKRALPRVVATPRRVHFLDHDQALVLDAAGELWLVNLREDRAVKYFSEIDPTSTALAAGGAAFALRTAQSLVVIDLLRGRMKREPRLKLLPDHRADDAAVALNDRYLAVSVEAGVATWELEEFRKLPALKTRTPAQMAFAGRDGATLWCDRAEGAGPDGDGLEAWQVVTKKRLLG